MARNFSQGDRFEVTFEAGRDGSPMTHVNGKVSFPERGGKLPKVGETWEVELAGTNPKGTVHFLRLLHRLEERTIWKVTASKDIAAGVPAPFISWTTTQGTKEVPSKCRAFTVTSVDQIDPSWPADVRQQVEVMVGEYLRALKAVNPGLVLRKGQLFYRSKSGEENHHKPMEIIRGEKADHESRAVVIKPRVTGPYRQEDIVEHDLQPRASYEEVKERAREILEDLPETAPLGDSEYSEVSELAKEEAIQRIIDDLLGDSRWVDIVVATITVLEGRIYQGSPGHPRYLYRSGDKFYCWKSW